MQIVVGELIPTLRRIAAQICTTIKINGVSPSGVVTGHGGRRRETFWRNILRRKVSRRLIGSTLVQQRPTAIDGEEEELGFQSVHPKSPTIWFIGGAATAMRPTSATIGAAKARSEETNSKGRLKGWVMRTRPATSLTCGYGRTNKIIAGNNGGATIGEHHDR